ncbi:MAG: hypothetical protein ABI743_02465, partial [bacterium]
MQEQGIHFDEQGLPRPIPQYIVWGDVMGSREALVYNFASAAKHILKFQQTLFFALAKCWEGSEYPEYSGWYPVMDGAYLAFSLREELVRTIQAVFIQNAH